jgi:hypothetical protein
LLRNDAGLSEIPNDFIGCLPAEFEIELCPRPGVIPVGEMLEFAASHWPLRSTDTGPYKEADGTVTLIDAEGDVYNGAISADGNAL